MLAGQFQAQVIQLTGWRRTIAHTVWWIVLILTFGTWIGAFINDYSFYLSSALTATQVDLLAELGTNHQAVQIYISGLKAFTMGVYLIVAVLIFWKRPNEWHTILVSATLIMIGAVTTWVFPSLSTAQPYIFSMSILITILGWFAFGLLFVIFPDGRLIPKWSKWFLLFYFIIIIVSNFLVDNPFRSDSSSVTFGILIALLFAFGIYAQIYRYIRVSTWNQQQQTKWVIYAFIITALLIQVIEYLPTFYPDITNPNTISGAFYALFIYDLQYRIVYLLLPLALGVAILQYRLYDIDVIIRRTLIYSILTLLLAAIFFGGVTILQSLFISLSGQASSIAIVISTLLIAALFMPIRNRIQTLIDKRFYRARYNAEKTMTRFALAAREEVEIDRLAEELINVVHETMQPEHIKLHLTDMTNSNK